MGRRALIASEYVWQVVEKASNSYYVQIFSGYQALL